MFAGAAGDRAAIMKQGLRTIEHHFGSGRLAKDKPRVKSIREWPWEKAFCHQKPSTSSSIPSRRFCLSVKSAGENYVQINREGGSKPKWRHQHGESAASFWSAISLENCLYDCRYTRDQISNFRFRRLPTLFMIAQVAYIG
jgi:hypothetical protein